MKRVFSLVKSNTFLRNSIVLFIGTMIANVLNYAFHLIIGRMVTPEEYGEIESLISLLAIISVPAATLTLVATKYAANMKAIQSKAGVRALSLYLNRKIILYGTPLFLLALFLVPLVKDFLNIEASLPLILLFWVMFLSFLSAVTAGILTGWQRFLDLNISSVLSTILKLVVAFLFVWWGFGGSGGGGRYAISILLGY